MKMMNSLFSTALDPEEVLPEFIQWYHEQGNARGGYSVDEMPQKMIEIAQALEISGYVEFWSGDMYCIKDKFRSKLLISYEWDKLAANYIKNGRLARVPYNQIVRNMWFNLHYYFPKDEKDEIKKDKAIKKAKEELFKTATLDDLMGYCFDGGCQIKLQDNELIDDLCNAKTPSEIERILQRPFERVYISEYPEKHEVSDWFIFIYSKEYLVVLANLQDKGKIKELLSNNMPGVERMMK